MGEAATIMSESLENTLELCPGLPLARVGESTARVNMYLTIGELWARAYMYTTLKT